MSNHNTDATPPTRWIEAEPSSKLQLIVVVPVFAEYENGNIFRLIESFTHQTATTDSFEIICVVNNTPELAQAKSLEFHENQKAMGLVGLLKDESGDLSELSEYRRKVIEAAREKHLQVHVIDLSTNGIDRNIGLFRDLGLQEAIERFKQNGRGGNGIVAQFDADTVPEPRYVEKIIAHFSDQHVESIFVTLDYYISEGPDYLFETSFEHQYKNAYFQWLSVLDGSAIRAGGPQSIARVSAYQKVGGIVHKDMAEDFALSEALGTNTNAKVASNVTVYTNDRLRDVGYDSSMRVNRHNYQKEHQIEQTNDVRYSRPRLLLFLLEIEVIAKASPELFDDVSNLEYLFIKYGIPFDAQLFREQVVQHRTDMELRHRVGLYTSDYMTKLGLDTGLWSNEYVDEAVHLFHQILPPSETSRLDELVRQQRLRAVIRLHASKQVICQAVELVFSLGSVTPADVANNAKAVEFVTRNPWLVTFLNDLPSQYQSASQAIDALKTMYPEWLGEFNQSRMRRSTAIMRALVSFLGEVRNDPTNFPQATDYLDRMEKKKR